MRSLFSAPHKVISGLALVPLSTYAQDVGSDVTTVHPRRMTPEQIAAHIAGGSSEVTRRRAEGSRDAVWLRFVPYFACKMFGFVIELRLQQEQAAAVRPAAGNCKVRQRVVTQ